MVLYTVGTVAKIEAALLVLPLIVSLIYKESCALQFSITIAISLAIGFALSCFFKPSNKVIYAKEGFAIVTLTWIVLSLIGCLPFYLTGEIPSFVDAFFETVSGFTTTGASIVNDVESMSKGILFWRSFTHWVGGMGVLVFVLAIIPTVSDRNIHILRAEAPGPLVGKIVPKMKHTARILYVIYIIMTLVTFLFLVLGGMPLFDSFIHAVGSAGTGGFGVKSDSVGSYAPYFQWVITIAMVAFGVNFNVYYFILIKKYKSAFKNEEFIAYIIMLFLSVAVIAFNILPVYNSIGESVRHSAFQVASIISTTGFSTVDFNQWPGLSKTILLILMFSGACAGSTAGGFKVSRILLLLKTIKRELQRLIHPRSVAVVRLDSRRVDETTIASLHSYFAVYVALYVVVVILLSVDVSDIETNISAAAACFNNIGPGLSLVGPMSNYNVYSPFSKILLSFAMLLGRLEIIPIILTFSPLTWKKKKSIHSITD